MLHCCVLHNDGPVLSVPCSSLSLSAFIEDGIISHSNYNNQCLIHPVLACSHKHFIYSLTLHKWRYCPTRSEDGRNRRESYVILAGKSRSRGPQQRRHQVYPTLVHLKVAQPHQFCNCYYLFYLVVIWNGVAK